MSPNKHAAPTDSPKTKKQRLLARLCKRFDLTPQDRRSLLEMLQAAQRHRIIAPEAHKMIEGVLRVFDSQVRDIMIPRAQMVVVEEDASAQDFLPIIIESGHSRFPVIGTSRDEVIGILLAKDLLRYRLEEQFDIHKILRPPVFIPESKRVNVLLNEFRAKRNHMAIVIDEYGGVGGLITIEDVLEQIVGQIEDEFDIQEELGIKKTGHQHYTVRALTPIEDFNRYFHTQFSNAEFDTIGGLITHEFGHVPKRGEALTLIGIKFQVLHANRRRVRSFRVTVVHKEYTSPQAMQGEPQTKD